jgi:hypothetical protein
MHTTKIENNLITQPTKLNINLYPHQLCSVFEMEKREREKMVDIRDTKYNISLGILSDKSGYGKCHGINTPILMYDGTIKKVQDIKTGDFLMGDDSKSREVLQLCTGSETLYEIKQKNGDNYIVNKSHILSLKYMCNTDNFTDYKDNSVYNVYYIDKTDYTHKYKQFFYNKNNKKKIKQLKNDFLKKLDKKLYIDIPLTDYLSLPFEIQNNFKGYKKSIDFKEITVNFDSYIVGLFISGDKLKKTNDDMYKYLKEFCKKNMYHIEEDSNQYIIIKNKFSSKENILENIILDKFIPDEYKINSRQIRMKILSGILDSKAVYNEGEYKLNEKNKRIKDDIKFICRSLGLEIYEEENYLYIKGDDINEIPVKRIVIDNKTQFINYEKKDIITDIEIVKKEKDKYYGFTINGNNRYLLGDFTVTHNSLSIVALILRDKMQWDLNTLHVKENINLYCNQMIIRTDGRLYEKMNCTILLANKNLINQWIDEFKHTQLKVDSIFTNKHIDTVKPEYCDVIIVSPTMYNKFISKYNNCAWKRFVYDEPGSLKISSMKEIVCNFNWFVTATPLSIVDKHRSCKSSYMYKIVGDNEFYNFFKYIDIINVKNNDEFVEDSFKMPKTYNKYYICNQLIYNNVKGIVNNKILEMIEAGDIDSAIKSLGGDKTCNIMELVKRKKQEEKEEIISKVKIYTIRNDDSKIKEWKDKEKIINKQIIEIDKRFEFILNTNCSICYEQLEKPVMEPSCQNIFCGKCILTWFKTNNDCPLCRKKTNLSDLIYVEKKESDTFNDDNKNSDKLKTKEEILEDIVSKDGKFLIFSSWDNTFNKIYNVIEKYSFSELKGTVNQQYNIINNFKEGKIKILFLNSKNNGSGLNLQEVTDIILYHKMDEKTISQIIGRANRIGRNISLNVHHLINNTDT